jgi:hypothetical protein
MRRLGWQLALLLALAPMWAPTRVIAQSTQPATSPATLALTQPATRPATAVIGDPDELLRKLSDSDWHVRRQAQAQLVEGGQDAKPFILDLVHRATDSEARKNALAAIAQIDENRLLGPSYITLHVKDASPATVFAEISRQCFAPLPTVPDNLWQEEGFAKITLDVDRQPFWKVVPQICQKVGVDFRPYQTGLRLMRAGGMQTGGVSIIQGPFLVIATQITYSRTRSLVANRVDQAQFGMNLSVYAEPKINVLRGSGSVQVDEVTDDHGNSLLPRADGPRRNWSGFVGVGGWNLYAPLHYPEKNVGTKIVKFRGSTGFDVQTESQKIALPDIASLKQTTRVIHGMQVTFQDMKKNNDTWQLRIHVAQPDLGGADWQQFIDGVQSRMQVLDTEGIPLDHRGMSTSSNNAAIDLTLDFGRSTRPDGRLSGEPSRVSWEVPTKTRRMSVPIELKDIPLFDEK